jgi:3-oxoacyl-[acyl-carrier protein] reductase
MIAPGSPGDRRVMLTGLGAVSCLGNGIGEFWNGLLSGGAEPGEVGLPHLNMRATKMYLVPEAAIAHGPQTLAGVRLGSGPRMAVAAARQALADAQAEAELGPLSTVVTCAGVARDRPLAMMSGEDWSEVIRTNLDGTFNICRAAAMPLMRHGSGCLITMSSVSGVYGNIAQSNYAASKAGIIGFTKSLARELGRFGTRCNVVAPGLIETDLTAGVAEKARKSLFDRIALGRPGTPQDVADLVSFLASGRARYITGQVIGVDGGLVP